MRRADRACDGWRTGLNRTVVITGGTSGIGLATAERLALGGARLILVGHDQSHIDEARHRLRRRAPEADVTIHRLDLSSLVEAKELAETLSGALDRIDTLINNAGAIFAHRELTPEGIERTFALNHMSHFVLTLSLLGHDSLLENCPLLSCLNFGVHSTARDQWQAMENQRSKQWKQRKKRAR